MSWYGWTDKGNPGSVKKDADGHIIARHGDATWKADVEKAIEADKRERAMARLERYGGGATGVRRS